MAPATTPARPARLAHDGHGAPLACARAAVPAPADAWRLRGAARQRPAGAAQNVTGAAPHPPSRRPTNQMRFPLRPRGLARYGCGQGALALVERMQSRRDAYGDAWNRLRRKRRRVRWRCCLSAKVSVRLERARTGERERSALSASPTAGRSPGSALGPPWVRIPPPRLSGQEMPDWGRAQDSQSGGASPKWFCRTSSAVSSAPSTKPCQLEYASPQT